MRKLTPINTGKPDNCNIYLDADAEENGGRWNLFYWSDKYEPWEIMSMGLKRVGKRHNGEDIFFDGYKARAFEEHRKSVNILNPDSFNDIWRKIK